MKRIVGLLLFVWFLRPESGCRVNRYHAAGKQQLHWRGKRGRKTIEDRRSGEVRKATGMPTFHASRIPDVATARHAVSAGLLDMVGMTRAHMADPHIVTKIIEGREEDIRPCVGATYCLDRIYQAGEALCIHNPSTGRELTMPHVIEPAAARRKVVVVGAGPAGMEAARVAAERGHDVMVFEAQSNPGGQIRLTAPAKAIM